MTVGEGLDPPFLMRDVFFAPGWNILIPGVKTVKEEEKKPIPWEAADPKPPVIRSGHMEKRVRN